jgi:iron(III) transport system permease protein
VAFGDLTVVALAMVVLALVAIGPADAWAGAPGAVAVRSGPGGSTAPAAKGRVTTLVVSAYALGAVGVPLVTVALAAVTRAPGLPPAPANWTLANFPTAFTGVTGAALTRTLWLALATAALVPLLGGAVAGLSARSARGPLATAVLLGYAVPGSALAVGILIGYGRLLAGSAVLILIAYLAKFWVFGHRPILAALDRLPPELTRAARASGAGPVTALRTVVLPPLAVAAATGGGLAFLSATHELTMSTILYGPGSETFAVVILNRRELGDVGASAALALVQLVPVALTAVFLAQLGRVRRSRR